MGQLDRFDQSEHATLLRLKNHVLDFQNEQSRIENMGKSHNTNLSKRKRTMSDDDTGFVLGHSNMNYFET